MNGAVYGRVINFHMIKNYFFLLRFHQYIKNFFIFLPVFFGLKIFDYYPLIATSAAFSAFCLVSSAVYIFNDYIDREADKKHPTKCRRPLAAGSVTIKSAAILMAGLLSSGLMIAFTINIHIFILIVSYVILNILYSVKLKQIAIIDVFIISAGFVIRIYIGYEASGIMVSEWLIIMTFLLALFLALAKRRDDLIIFHESGNKMRKVIDGYSLEFLNVTIMVMTSVLIVSYIMYTVSPEIRWRAGSDKLYLTVIWVIMGLMRYLHVIYVANNSGSPTMVLLKDRFLQIIVIGWLVTFGIFLYN